MARPDERTIKHAASGKNNNPRVRVFIFLLLLDVGLSLSFRSRALRLLDPVLSDLAPDFRSRNLKKKSGLLYVPTGLHQDLKKMILLTLF